MIRIGIIGLGFMGKTHYGIYARNPEAQVVAVSDIDPKRAAGDLTGASGHLDPAEESRLPMQHIRGTTDWRELIAMKDVDVVDVCLPTPAHVEVVPPALAAGKHVICEKPLARTSADARVIADAAARAKGLFMPAMCMRFWPEWAWLKRAVVEGHYGRVLAAMFRRVGSYPAKGWLLDGSLSGGAALDLHIHDTDFVYHLFGKPRGVFSRGYTGESGEIDHVFTQYLYDSPHRGTPMVSAEAAWTMSPGFAFAMRYTVVFERATADYDLTRKDTLMLYADGRSEPVPHAMHNGWTGELGYFLECVKTRQKPERVTADDAVAGLQIIEAERRSAASANVEVV
jgi:predicted dehydrogenase